MTSKTDHATHFRHAYTKDRGELLNRLRRIEGQVRGIQRLVDDEAYCLDILQQVEAMTAAADSVALLLLEDHIDGCLAHAIETGSRRAVRRRGDDGGAPRARPPGGEAQRTARLKGVGVPRGGTTTLPSRV